jgi:hypothetical protein
MAPRSLGQLVRTLEVLIARFYTKMEGSSPFFFEAVLVVRAWLWVDAGG